MLTFYGFKTHGTITVDMGAERLPDTVNWIDAFNPTTEEMTFLRRMIGVRVPTRADLDEIESSSRLATDGDALLMSFPATMRDETGYPDTTPIGFVVTTKAVVTIRFAHLPSFENLAHQICEKGDLAEGGFGATVTILEIIIDHIADLLERVGDDLDKMSRRIFTRGLVSGKDKRPRKANRALSEMLQFIGSKGDLVSKVSESLLGLSRIAPFLASKGGDRITPEIKTRLDTVGQDAKSLHEFQDHLSNKTQFLLDALLGLANIEQNNVFRVLTVVSVVGIPPTFVASMYGMNFKSMPELEWTHGYAYGLTLIFLSAVIPALWFKVKGWW